MRCRLAAGLLGAGVFAACQLAPPPRPPGPPNLVLVFLDDAGWGDFACYGNPVIRTPQLDRMAREGTRFTQFYTPSPACTASRYALLTGRVGPRSGFGWVLVPESPRGIHPAERTLAEELRAAGYATACFGKWHLGRPAAFLPTAHGFDEYLGIPYSNDMQPPKWPSLPLLAGEVVVEEDPDQSTFTRRFTEAALDFIHRHRHRPFFLYLAHPMPHVPLHPGPAWAGRSRRGTYGDVIEELDWSIGSILQALREEGLARDTLVLVTSDNGPWLLKGRAGGSAGPLRDGKGSTWEGGVRVPALAWWPGTVPAGRVERRVASTLDVLPTFLALAGRPAPGDRALDGTDIRPLLLGRPAPPHPALFFYGPGNRLQALRDGPWKLHLRTNSQLGLRPFEGRLPLLFHLEHDPGETVDLAAEHPEVVARLQALAAAQEARVAAAGSFWDP